MVRDWVQFSSQIIEVEWVNFHLKHKDHVKVKVKTTNAALNSITSETDGFVVDLTPAILLNLGDGTALNQDQIFQVSFLVLPYLGLHNAQDVSQILYFVGVVCIINRNNVFHSFPDWEITCPQCFFVYYCQHAKLNIS